MKVKVRWQGREEEVEMQEGATALDLLKKLGVCREAVVVSVGGRIVPEERILKDGEEVVIRSIVTGG